MHCIPTSTFGEDGTLCRALVTVCTKESICCFLRPLRATSFSNSSICVEKSSDQHSVSVYNVCELHTFKANQCNATAGGILQGVVLVVGGEVLPAS